jgi:hypothetical protein
VGVEFGVARFRRRVRLVSFRYVLLRWLLELVALHGRSNDFKETQGRRSAARTRHPSAGYAPTADHRSRPHVPGRGEPVALTLALAIVHRHAGDSAALASTPRREAVDVRTPVGRPPIPRETRELVLRLARETRAGAPRKRGSGGTM